MMKFHHYFSTVNWFSRSEEIIEDGQKKTMQGNKLIGLIIVATLLISQVSAGPFTYLTCIAICGGAAGIITAVIF